MPMRSDASKQNPIDDAPDRLYREMPLKSDKERLGLLVTHYQALIGA